MSLILPASVARELANRERAVHEDAELVKQCRIAKEIEKELKAIDPYLEVVYIKQPNDWPRGEDPPLGIVFGRWHVKRYIVGSIDQYYPYTGPKGEFREPDSGMIRMLEHADWGDARVRRDFFEKRLKDAEARQKLRDVKFEEAKEELLERMKMYDGSRSFWMGAKTANKKGFSNVRPGL